MGVAVCRDHLQAGSRGSAKAPRVHRRSHGVLRRSARVREGLRRPRGSATVLFCRVFDFKKDAEGSAKVNRVLRRSTGFCEGLPR